MENIRMHNPTHRIANQRQRGPSTKPSVRWNYQLNGSINAISVWDESVYLAVENSIVAIGTDGSTQWRFQTGDTIVSPPAVVDNSLYVCSDDQNIYAINAHNGSKEWSFQIQPSYNKPRAPVVAGGTVYFTGLTEGDLYALNASTGIEKWRFTNGSAAPPAVVDGTIYVSGFETLYALDPNTGIERWSFTASDQIHAPAVVDETVYFGSDDQKLYALDARIGVEQWKFKSDDWVMTSPTVVDGVVYFVNRSGNFYALDAAGGTKKWCNKDHTYPSDNPLAVVDNTVYYTHGKMYALDAIDGSERWDLELDSSLGSTSVVVVDGSIYTGAHDGNVYALSEKRSNEETDIYYESDSNTKVYDT